MKLYELVIAISLVSCSQPEPKVIDPFPISNFYALQEQCYTICATEICLCRCRIAIDKVKNLSSEEAWEWKQSWIENLDKFLSNEELGFCE